MKNEWMERSLLEHEGALSAKEYSARELTLAFLRQIEERDGWIGAYLTRTAEEALRAADGVDAARLAGESLSPLAGIPMALKDNLCTEGIPTTCASRFLENYRPPYDATVWERLRSCGAVLLGKTNMDEFGMGSTNEHSAVRAVRNPLNPDLTPGGSSGGSAAAVAGGMAVYALGTDTGGSIRQPAAFCGLVGMRPTYGRVSRYGLVSYASSFDTVGPITRSVRDNAEVLAAMIGEDPKDATSAAHSDVDVRSEIGRGMKGLRIGILRELDRTTMEACVRETLRRTVQRAMDLGAEIVECSAPSLTLASEAYCVIASAEASSNLARFDGVRYGRRADAYADMEELLCRSRSEGFGKEVKRRLLLGTYLLSGGCREGYYGRALSLRRVLTEEIGRALGGCDALLLPVAPTPAFPLGQKTEDTALRFSEDLFCAVASLVGLPALSLPMGRNEAGLPIGLQLMGRVDSEGLLYRMGASLEDAFREEDRA